MNSIRFLTVTALILIDIAHLLCNVNERINLCQASPRNGKVPNKLFHIEAALALGDIGWY